MAAERERNLTLSDPGRDAAGEELDLILQESEDTEPAEDAGFESFLERLPFVALLRGKKT